MIRRTLALGLAATAVSAAFATAPAEATTVCVANNPVIDGCVHILENNCVIYGGGDLGSTGAWAIACLP